MTLMPVRQWQNCLDESASRFALMCLRYSCSQEIDSRYATEFGSTVQSRKSCRMRYFCHAQLFEITRANKIKDAGRRSAWIASSCRHPKTCTLAVIS